MYLSTNVKRMDELVAMENLVTRPAHQTLRFKDDFMRAVALL